MGRYTLPLLDRGYRNLAGLDLTEFLLNQLRTYCAGRYDIPLYCTDVSDHPKELDGQFDFVIGFFTLHRLHNLERCFAAMREMLKPSGRIAFLEPNAYNVSYYLQILLSPRMTWEGDKGVCQMRPGLCSQPWRRRAFAIFVCGASDSCRRCWPTGSRSVLWSAQWRVCLR